jgi:hypothetical protein
VEMKKKDRLSIRPLEKRITLEYRSGYWYW